MRNVDTTRAALIDLQRCFSDLAWFTKWYYFHFLYPPPRVWGPPRCSPFKYSTYPKRAAVISYGHRHNGGRYYKHHRRRRRRIPIIRFVTRVCFLAIVNLPHAGAALIKNHINRKKKKKISTPWKRIEFEL